MSSREDYIKAIEEFEKFTGFEFMHRGRGKNTATLSQLKEDVQHNIDWLMAWVDDAEACFRPLRSEE